MSSCCIHCGQSEVETDLARGATVCVSCGVVLQESAVVSEVQFEENAHGASTAVGQFVPSDSKGGAFYGLGSCFGPVYQRDSREVTVMKAKSSMSYIGSSLKIHQTLIDTAMNFYKMALSRQMTKGRRSTLVYAACLYLACRSEKTPHLLIDFCDLLQLDVFALGRTCAYLTQELCIHLPYLDPCVYLLRYAQQMGFEDSTTEVYTTALRILRRMKRDSLHHGRVPAGLCGAALLLAARCHNFSRTVNDVVKVVKIHETTLRKRLKEFGDTPSSLLTIDEFLRVDLGEEQDPPSYKAARLKDNAAFQNDKEYEEKFKSLEKAIEQQLEKSRKRRRNMLSTDNESVDGELSETMSEIVDDPSIVSNETSEEGSLVRDLETQKDKHETQCPDELLSKSDSEKTEMGRSLLKDVLEVDELESLAKQVVIESTLDTIEGCVSKVETSQQTEEEVEQCVGPSLETLGLLQESNIKCPGHLNEEKVYTFDDIDDDNIDSYIMTPREKEAKSKTWNSVYGPFLEELKEKQAQAAKDKEVKGPKRKRKPKTKVESGHTPSDALEKVLKVKKVSSKINYEVLKCLNTKPYSDFKMESYDNDMPSTSNAGLINEVDKAEDFPDETKSIGERPVDVDDDYDEFYGGDPFF